MSIVVSGGGGGGGGGELSLLLPCKQFDITSHFQSFESAIINIQSNNGKPLTIGTVYAGHHPRHGG